MHYGLQWRRMSKLMGSSGRSWSEVISSTPPVRRQERRRLSPRSPPGLQYASGRPSIRGFPVGVAVHRALENLRGGRDLGLGRLQDRLPARAGPGGERRAEVAVVGVFGRDRLALPVGELAGEGPVPGGQVVDPLVDLAG